MITFNPGPSHISDITKQFMRDFIDTGIGSISHRSKAFNEISLSLRENLIQYLQIPKGYTIFYLASASEVMEVILRNTIVSRSHHFVNEAFSKKFYSVA
jgi:phosphoserine aminotransferase